MRGGGGFGRRPPRKDYSLLRDGQDEQLVFDAEEGKRPTGATVWRLLGLARGQVWALTWATVALGVGSAATVAVPKLAGKLIDICINFSHTSDRKHAEQQINEMLFQILAILAVGGVASGIRSWLFQGAAERVMCSLRSRLFRWLMGQEMGFFDCTRTGELQNRLSEDTRLMKTAGTVSISVALRSTVVALFGLFLMFSTSVRLSLLSLAILPVLLASFYLYAQRNRKYTSDQLTASAAASTVAEECFGSIRTVRGFGKEAAACARYDAAVVRTQSYGIKSARLGGFFQGFNFTVSTGAIVVVLWYGARLVVEGAISAGELSAFVLYALYVSGNVGQLAGVFSSLIQAVGASERVFQLLDRTPRMPRSGTLKPLGSPAGGDIEFKDVWFSYPSRPESKVLCGINLHIPPGRKVALVGQSGGGKTTMVNLLQRFYDPTSGSIQLDSTPLPDIDHEWLHQQVSIVSQEPVLFAESILYNMTFGLPGGADSVSMAEVEEAARIANAHDFIASFPQGYATSVGERGVRLSGGQKQRVAIARAILTRPRVLLLDEATSALDAESEGLVQEALDRIAEGRTVVIIAHRLSTVTSSDEVCVMAAGSIAERGTHAELLTQEGVYATLVRRQLTPGTSIKELPATTSSSADNHDTANGAVRDMDE